jgi:hypothetical protein
MPARLVPRFHVTRAGTPGARVSRPVLVRTALAPSAVLAAALLYGACDGAPSTETPPVAVPPAAKAEVPKVEGPAPTLLLASAQFVKGPDGKPKPGPALLTMWRKSGDSFTSSTLEDPDSNVFHKVMPDGAGGLYSVGAEGAFLKRWTQKDGKWTAETLWNPHWEGKFQRLRDLEIGDVTGDGQDDFVMATHDSGVLGVVSKGADGAWVATELRKQADTFVHEVEICDVDGDGKKEFFATPSARNQSSGKSQPGQVVMYRFLEGKWTETLMDDFAESHAKEILCADVDGGGGAEFFSVVEAHTELVDGKATIKNPVEVRQYRFKGDKVEHTVIATIDDRQTRFLIPGDFNQDGKTDLVAAAMKTGLWLLTQNADGTWSSTNFETNSSGFEHASWGADLDGDGKLELYVAADEQRELRRYVWNAATSSFDRVTLGRIQNDTITWNITSATM